MRCEYARESRRISSLDISTASGDGNLKEIRSIPQLASFSPHAEREREKERKEIDTLITKIIDISDWDVGVSKVSTADFSCAHDIRTCDSAALKNFVVRNYECSIMFLVALALSRKFLHRKTYLLIILVYKW